MINADDWRLEKFVKRASWFITKDHWVLDAGAGDKKYKKYFNCNYESCDNLQSKRQNGEHTYICDIDKIPAPNEKYDYVLCTQVLEHTKEPQKALIELARVVKTGGTIILTVPMSWFLHEEPHNYYNFTPYSIYDIASKSGLYVYMLEQRGGYFSYLGNILMNISKPLGVNKGHFPKLLYYLLFGWLVVLSPFLQLLDFLDKTNKLTLGYNILLYKEKIK